jgi:hypothetical protein
MRSFAAIVGQASREKQTGVSWTECPGSVALSRTIGYGQSRNVGDEYFVTTCWAVLPAACACAPLHAVA